MIEAALIILSLSVGAALLELANRLEQRGHKFVYRNPFTRTCATCNRQEDYYDYGGRRGGWEAMREGSGDKCSPANSRQANP